MGWRKANGPSKDGAPKAEANKWDIPKITPTMSTSPKRPGMSYADAAKSVPPISKKMGQGHACKNTQCNYGKNSPKGGYNWWVIPVTNVMDRDPLTNSSGERKKLTKSIIDL